MIKQFQDGDNFYMVESGVLTCTKRTNPGDKKEIFLKQYVEGESFGELALLYNAPRAASIKVKSQNCELWSLERGAFNAIIKKSVQKKREKYEDFLDEIEIFNDLNQEEKTRVCDAFKEHYIL